MIVSKSRRIFLLGILATPAIPFHNHGLEPILYDRVLRVPEFTAHTV